LGYDFVAYKNTNFELVVGHSRLKVGFEFDISGKNWDQIFCIPPSSMHF
jgi:hypothetical protein